MTNPANAPAAPDANAVLNAVGAVPYEWRIDTDALTWGPSAAVTLGISDEKALASGRGYAHCLDSKNLQTRYDVIMQSGRSDNGAGVPYQVQYALRGNGAPLWVDDTGRWFGGLDGRPQVAHGLVRVIADPVHNEQRFASPFDRVTGAVNRWRLTELLSECIDDASRHGRNCAFLLAGIDNLARINEAYGYSLADELIAAVAKRIRGKLRGADILGRFSGNKFGIILKNCTTDEMSLAADRLLSCVRDDIVHAEAGKVAVTLTVSGLILPRHARDVQEALARAQETLDLAKQWRSGSFFAYRPSIEREVKRRENLRATDEIVAALNDRRIALAYEPVADAATRRPAFYEALIRIRRTDGEYERAASIIPVAERLGLVRLLDNRALELALAELVENPDLRLSLNVSPASTVHADWWNYLAAQLRAQPGLGERLTVELTETVEIRDVEETRGFVNRVKDLGCRIAIDDFGSGFTSFRNLRMLGVDVVKIDGAFVQNLTRSEDDRTFVRTMLDLARSMGLTTVAEWVQSEEAAAMLKGWGCDLLQGELIGLASFERPWSAAPKEQAAG